MKLIFITINATIATLYTHLGYWYFALCVNANRSVTAPRRNDNNTSFRAPVTRYGPFRHGVVALFGTDCFRVIGIIFVRKPEDLGELYDVRNSSLTLPLLSLSF